MAVNLIVIENKLGYEGLFADNFGLASCSDLDDV
jgi:hypothetical protein